MNCYKQKLNPGIRFAAIVLTVIYCILSPGVGFPANLLQHGNGEEAGDHVMNKVYTVKLKALNLNMKIMKNKIFSQSNFNLFFSLNMVHPYIVKHVKFTLDGEEVFSEPVSGQQLKLLKPGAATRLYFTDLDRGNHFFKVEIEGYEHGRLLVRKNEVHFKKGVRPVFLDLTIHDHDKLPPETLKIIEYSKMDTLKTESLKDLLIRNFRFHMNASDYFSALTILNLAYDINQHRDANGDIRLLMARTYNAWNMLDFAEEILESLIQKFKRGRVYNSANYQMGRISYQKNIYSDAVMFSRKVIETVAANSKLANKTYFLIGESYLKMKEYNRAIDAFSKISATNNDFLFARFNMAKAHYESGNTGQSEKILLELDKTFNITRNFKSNTALAEQARKTLAYLYIEQEKYNSANAVFNKISERSIIADEVLFGIGWSYLQKEDYVRAIIAFKELVSRYPESRYAGEAMLNIGYAYTKLSSFNKAVSVFNKLIGYSRHRIDQIDELTLNMIETRFSDYILSSIISTNTRFYSYHANQNSDLLFSPFPELTNSVALISAISQFKEFVYIARHLELMFQAVVESEQSSMFKTAEGIEEQTSLSKLTGSNLNKVIRDVSHIKTEYFVRVSNTMRKELLKLKRSSSELALEATVRIASNMIHDKYGVRLQRSR